MNMTAQQIQLIKRVLKEKKKPPVSAVPSGGENNPLTEDEKLFRDSLRQQMKAQLSTIHSNIKEGDEIKAVRDATSKEWDHKIAVAVRPVWFKLFKEGGDEALKRIKKFKRSLKDISVVSEKMIEEAEEVEVKAPKQKPPASIVIAEWVESPETLEAVEKELFAFAHSINQTTADRLRSELLEAMEAGESITSIKHRIQDISDEWVEGWRSEMIARTETARAFSTGSITAWKSTGVVERKIWHAAGDACPFCLDLNGTVVGLEENFFDEDEIHTTKWRGHQLEMGHGYAAVNGPPLHPNCRCVLLAELSEG